MKVRVLWGTPSFNAQVAQLVEAMVLEAIQCEFESHLGYQYGSMAESGLRHLSRKQWVSKEARGFESYYFRQFLGYFQQTNFIGSIPILSTKVERHRMIALGQKW